MSTLKERVETSDAIQIDESNNISIDLGKMPEFTPEEMNMAYEIVLNSTINALKTKDKALRQILNITKDTVITQIIKDALK